MPRGANVIFICPILVAMSFHLRVRCSLMRQARGNSMATRLKRLTNHQPVRHSSRVRETKFGSPITFHLLVRHRLGDAIRHLEASMLGLKGDVHKARLIWTAGILRPEARVCSSVDSRTYPFAR